MNRRNLLKGLLGIIALPVGGRVMGATAEKPLLLQQGPVAGFAHYQGEALWSQLQVGDQLTLAREPGNPYDKRAIAIYWRDKKLGYVPRQANYTLAQMLDRNQRLQAHISQLSDSSNP